VARSMQTAKLMTLASKSHPVPEAAHIPSRSDPSEWRWIITHESTCSTAGGVRAVAIITNLSAR
jgi:hypothetical protein